MVREWEVLGLLTGAFLIELTFLVGNVFKRLRRLFSIKGLLQRCRCNFSRYGWTFKKFWKCFYVQGNTFWWSWSRFSRYASALKISVWGFFNWGQLLLIYIIFLSRFFDLGRTFWSFSRTHFIFFSALDHPTLYKNQN